MEHRSDIAAAREGDAVIAQNGSLGRIERIVRPEPQGAVYLVVAAGRMLRRRYPVLSGSLVTTVDSSRRRVHVRGRRELLERLPETLPLVH